MRTVAQAPELRRRLTMETKSRDGSVIRRRQRSILIALGIAVLSFALDTGPYAGMSLRHHLSGTIEEMDFTTFTLENPKLHKRWRIKRSALSAKFDPRPGRKVLVELSPKEFTELSWR
jgi:hypothetical protein